MGDRANKSVTGFPRLCLRNHRKRGHCVTAGKLGRGGVGRVGWASLWHGWRRRAAAQLLGQPGRPLHAGRFHCFAVVSGQEHTTSVGPAGPWGGTREARGGKR